MLPERFCEQLPYKAKLNACYHFAYFRLLVQHGQADLADTLDKILAPWKANLEFV
jgi:hypothetical protein